MNIFMKTEPYSCHHDVLLEFALQVTEPPLRLPQLGLQAGDAPGGSLQVLLVDR